MIAMLSGIISEKLTGEVIVDVKGVGYGIYVTAEDYGRLTVDETVKVYVYEYVREQAHDLFGFLARDTQLLFQQLLDVNGVGPKMALNVLSVGPTTAVRTAVAGGDVKYIQQASGVGKKVAERIVVELKDKVGLVSVDLQSAGLLQSDAALLKDEAVEALVSLGYSTQDASKALEGVDPALSTEDRIKKALSEAKP